MAKRARPSRQAQPRGVDLQASQRPKFPKVAPGELLTLLDFVRYAVSRSSRQSWCSRTAPPIRWPRRRFWSAKPCICIPTSSRRFATARVTSGRSQAILDLVARRIATRKPAAYLVNKIYMRGLPFYVDERTIVPRSFIGELLDSHFSGESDEDGGSLIDDPASVRNVLDLCTGSGCLAILAGRAFSNARIDAVDISKDALEVAARNVAEYGLEDRVTLHQGDLFKPLAGRRYDLIISNPPYVDAQGMAGLPRECRAEPELAFDGGADGIAIVRRILQAAKQHLTPEGGLLCEIGRWPAGAGGRLPQLRFSLARDRRLRWRGVLDQGRRCVSDFAAFRPG